LNGNAFWPEAAQIPDPRRTGRTIVACGAHCTVGIEAQEADAMLRQIGFVLVQRGFGRRHGLRHRDVGAGAYAVDLFAVYGRTGYIDDGRMVEEHDGGECACG